VFEAKPDDRTFELADTLTASNCLESDSEFQRAESNLRRVMPLHEKLAGAESMEVARCKTELAAALLAQSVFDEAEKTFQESMRIMRKVEAQSSIDFADTLADWLPVCVRKDI